MPPPPPLKPETPITKIDVIVTTADVYAAGTDDTIHCRLIPLPNATEAHQFELVGSFERGDTDPTHVPPPYFAGCIVNDISLVQLYKDADSIYGGWKLKHVEVWVNDVQIYGGPTDGNAVWLQDGVHTRTWTAPDFKRLEFQAPTLPLAINPLAEPGTIVKAVLQVVGGKPPFTWAVQGANIPGWAAPKVTARADTRTADISGTGGPDKTAWAGTITVTEDGGKGQSASCAVTIDSRSTLPAPTLSGMTPGFGWPTGSVAGRGATVVTLTGSSFDVRPGRPLRVTFTGPANTQLDAVLGEERDQTFLQAVVPDNAVPGPVRVITGAGTATSSAPFQVHTWGYRITDGYACLNLPREGDDTDGFPDDFDWNRYEEAFGVHSMWVMTPFGGTVPDPYGALFYGVTRGFVGRGCCHGFSLSSLRFRQRLVGDLELPKANAGFPLNGTLFDLQNGKASPAAALSRMIQVGQLVMMSGEAIGFYTTRLASIGRLTGTNTMDARPMLADVSAELDNGWDDPRMIAFCRASNPIEGHVVVPHAVTPGTVHVYNCDDPVDPQHPADDNFSRFAVNASTGSWSFNMGNQVWSGAYCFSIPLTAYGHQYSWSLPSIPNLANAGLAFYFGSCTAGTDASVEPLDGLAPMPVVGPRPVHALTARFVRFRITSPVSPGGVVVMANDAPALSVEEVHGSVLVEIDLTKKTAKLTEEVLGSDVRPVLRAVTRDELRTVSRTSAIRPAAGRPHGTIGLDWAGAGVSLIASDTVDLHVRHIDNAAHDVAAELVGVPASRAANAVLGLTSNGLPTLTLASGVAVDMAALQQFIPSLPRHVAVVAQVGPALREAAAAARPRPAPSPRPLPRPSPQPIGPVVSPIGDRGRIVGVDNATRHLDPALFTPITVPLPAAAGTVVKGRGLAVTTPVSGPAQMTVPRGNRVEMLVEERDGHRSFPISVFISTASPQERAVPAHVVLADAPGIAASKVASVPLTLVVNGPPVSAVTIDLGPLRRVAGPGAEPPPSPEPSLALSPSLVALGATSNATPTGRGGVTLSVSWPKTAACGGRIPLGVLTAPVPDGAGAVHLLTGYASVSLPDGSEADVRVVPIELRRLAAVQPPGQPPPAITVPAALAQGQSTNLAVTNLPPGLTSIAWWLRSEGGDATLTGSGTLQPTLKGQLAGSVRVFALIGSQVVNRLLSITPVSGYSPLQKDDVPLPSPGAAPAATVNVGLVNLQQRFRDPIWNPGLFAARVDLGQVAMVDVKASIRLGQT